MTSEDREKFDAAIAAPVAGERQATGSWSREAELAQFLKA
jgi:hypothetical protein